MSIRDEQKRWEEKILKPLLSKYPERKPEFTTPSGIPLPRLLTEKPVDYLNDLGLPGLYPFTRGVQPTMYRGRFWTMRQYAGFATAEESNQRYRYLLSQGQTGLSVAFDLPTQIGYDADDPMSVGEVGKVGVSISTLEDMDVLFKEIPLGRVSTSMTINAPASILLAMYIAVAKRKGVESSKLAWNDPKRYSQGICRAWNVYLPAWPVDAPDHRHIWLLFAICALLEYDQHLRLPHP